VSLTLDVAADGARPLTRRIEGNVEAVLLEVMGEPEIDHARLDHRVTITQVDLEARGRGREKLFGLKGRLEGSTMV
jgi:hypothetical protein